jgi:hypothetical protein
MSSHRVVSATYGLLLIFAFALHSFEAFAQQSRQRLQRVGDIAFGLAFEDARETADAIVGVSYTTGDRRVLKTLAQTRVALFDSAFNLTYVFGTDDRLTRVFGSVVRAMDLDKKTCVENGAKVFAASVRQYGSPDVDKSGRYEREWRFKFADGRWIRLRYYFGGVLNACNIILDSVTPEGQNDHS